MYCLKYYWSVCNSRIRIENERLGLKKLLLRLNHSDRLSKTDRVCKISRIIFA